jgi:hypothetical protein
MATWDRKQPIAGGVSVRWLRGPLSVASAGDRSSGATWPAGSHELRQSDRRHASRQGVPPVRAARQVDGDDWQVDADVLGAVAVALQMDAGRLLQHIGQRRAARIGLARRVRGSMGAVHATHQSSGMQQPYDNAQIDWRRV